MSTGRLVAKNTFIQIAGKGISTVLGVAVVAIVTRALGQTGYGYYTTVITFLSFFGIVADLGLTLITAQMISEHGADEHRIVNSVMTFRVVSALIFFSLAPVAALFTPYPLIVKFGIALTAFSFFFVSLQQTLIGIFQKHLVMRYPMIAENIGRVALLGVTVYAFVAHKNVLWFLLAVVVGNLINFLCVQQFARRFVRLRFAWDSAVIADMWRRSLPIAISIMFNLIYLKADTLILSLVRPAAEVGVYGAAYRVIDILMMVPVMMMGVILPVATAAWSAGDHARVRRIVQKTIDAFALYAAPVLVGGLLLAAPLMQFVAGKEFAASGAPLKILLLAFVAATFSTLFGHTIVALGMQRRVVWVYGVDAVVSLAAYLAFIPHFGMAAAAWATCGSELFAALVLGWIVLHAVAAKINFVNIGYAVCASAVMGFIIYGARAWPVWALIVIGAVVYALIMWAGRVHERLL